MEKLNETLGGLILVAGAVSIVYIIARYNYLIKKAAFEKGVDLPSLNNRIRYLDLGCILLGIGLGLGVSSIFTFFELKEDTMDLLVWSTIVIFGGIGLLATHFIRKRFEA